MLTAVNKNWYLLFAVFSGVLFFGLGGCSSEKSTLVSKTYHNLTAHYNAYFYADQRLNEVIEAIESSYEPNYNRILQIFPPVDTTVVNSMRTQLDDAIKKAAIAIQFHKNSDWVDDSYVLIGRAKYYDSKFEEAIETFKYVNTISKDDQSANHAGLVALMRTYIDHGELNNAIAVSDFLNKEELNKDNLQELHLTRAYMFQKRDDLDNMVQNLVNAVELMNPAEGSAKIYFIIGQIYQTLGFDAEAHRNYHHCIKSNPSYELSFYASLNMAQVFELARSNDLKKVRRYYKRILKDSKNKEFRDKIYYEMAEFEMRQQHLDLAIEYYESSVAASINNNRQKAYSYLKLGLINYDTLRDYPKAKAYYDSTMMVLPQDEPDYLAIQERQIILEDFVDQLNTIELQDSLLTLASMDSLTLSALLDSVIVREERARLEKEEKEKEQQRQSLGRNINNEEAFTAGQPTGATWYFYNTSAVSAGQSEFIRRWGNRSLEDNWRRSNKDARITLDDTDENVTETEEGVVESGPTPEELRATQKEAYYQTIPFTALAKHHADSLIEVAYYNLGNIYNFQLQEKVNAASTFETMIDRYPSTEYKPEILYQLYLIYQDLGSDKSELYRDQLLADFPTSTFAKTLINPNFKQENDALAEQMQLDYKVAYDLYQQKFYDSAAYVLNTSIQQYPENSFTDNLKLLKILIEGHGGSLHIYRFQLQEFLKEYPESDVNEYAQQLLKSAQELPLKLANLGGATFQQNLNDNHIFVLVYPRDKANSNLAQSFDQFNASNFEGQGLSASSLIFDDQQALVLVQAFDSKSQALKYYEILVLSDLLANFDKQEVNNFVITEENFEIFYQTKDLEGYRSFFSNFYLE